jgi:single-strand selective monofunctional uracil DNA glycosylase
MPDNTSRLLDAAVRLRERTAPLVARAPLGPAAYVLAPLTYAWRGYSAYVERHAPPRAVEAVLLGMNPGPWGMAQTGVPFGSPDLVRTFLGIDVPIDAPSRPHPRHPVLGFASPRNEVSGQRIWGAVAACFGAPAPFFARFFVVNHCPLLFLAESGANVTPDKLPRGALDDCLDACDDHLAEVLRVLAPRTVIGVGAWAETRARAAVTRAALDVHVARILHPSPASPAANRGWREAALTQLAALGHPWPTPRPEVPA